MLVERISTFLTDAAASASFSDLASEALLWQYERIAAYRRLCQAHGFDPREGSWRQSPAVPTLAFKTLELAGDEPREVFRSSGTTPGNHSTHYHPFPDLYRSTIEATFPTACLGSLESPPMLSLIPGREQVADSSLGFMVDHILKRYSGPGSLVAFSPKGVDKLRARSFFSARQRDRRPAVVLATAFALVEILDGLERQNLHFRLPPGTVLFETGGYKGRTREVSRAQLEEGLARWLNIDPAMIVREYGMTELTSQFYAGAPGEAESPLFKPQAWTRVRILDPESLQPVAEGETGLICIFDLANIGSAVHLLTQDLGVRHADGFELQGRASGAELRGCSLTVEQLSAESGPNLGQ